eukprot:SAG31_NODE_2477_length_5637_cov_10.057241_10_plen_194_part_00
MMGLATLLQLAAGVATARIEDLNITDLVLCDEKGGGGKGAPTIIWSPSVAVTRQNVTLAVAQAQWKNGRNLVKAAAIISRSVDGGLSFGADQISLPGGAQLLASPLTATVHAFGVSVPNASASALSRAVSTDSGRTWCGVVSDCIVWGTDFPIISNTSAVPTLSIRDTDFPMISNTSGVPALNNLGHRLPYDF